MKQQQARVQMRMVMRVMVAVVSVVLSDSSEDYKPSQNQLTMQNLLSMETRPGQPGCARPRFCQCHHHL